MNNVFDIVQTDAQLQAILNKIQPLVTTGSTAPLGFGYGECTTVGATAAKTVSMTDTVLTPGGIIAVNFVNAFTTSSPTLSVNGSAAKPIKLYGNAMPMGKVHANTILVMYYDGTQFNVIGIQSQTAAAPTGFVDLALPSGLLWCEHNVGASTPYEDGLYFSWGNVEGHSEGSGYDFSDAVYAQTPGAALTGNIAVGNTYDMARHNMGAPCRLPTSGEFQELYNNCDTEWTDEDNVAGRRFTSRINGNSIFFPASGYYNGTSLNYRGTYGNYWSSTWYSETDARNLSFGSSNVNPQSSSNRRLGFTVRAVQ
jgi:hypothetical protein